MKAKLFLSVALISTILFASCDNETNYYPMGIGGRLVFDKDSLSIESGDLDSVSFHILKGYWMDLDCVYLIENGDTTIHSGGSYKNKQWNFKWITIKRCEDPNEVRVILQPNEGKERKAWVRLVDGDYTGSFTVKQKGKEQ